jgi:hypothetical protein
MGVRIGCEYTSSVRCGKGGLRDWCCVRLSNGLVEDFRNIVMVISVCFICYTKTSDNLGCYFLVV